jgi:hypothetical protein
MTSVGLDLWVHGGLTADSGEGDTCATHVSLLLSAGAALRQRVFLFEPSVTVCVVVCVRHMTSVPDLVLSTELWRFSTSTHGWDRVYSTVVNGAGPSARYGHVMTSVGLDLWVHGGFTGSGEGDSCATHVTLLLLTR